MWPHAWPDQSKGESTTRQIREDYKCQMEQAYQEMVVITRRIEHVKVHIRIIGAKGELAQILTVGAGVADVADIAHARLHSQFEGPKRTRPCLV